MKPFPDQASRDPFAARDDRTPDEVLAIRALAAELDALLDTPPGAPPPVPGDEDLAITQDALPILASTHDSAFDLGHDEPPPSSVGLESGLADRMRGVLRGVLDRTRRNRPPR